MATQTQIAAVQQLYIGYLGRAADKAGLDFWTNAVATGVSTLESVATGFTLSNEYKAAFGGLTNDALVEKVYTSVLGRASDTAGKAFWVDALAKGTVTADKLVATFIGALSAPDQTIINNKTFVAQTYTDTVGADYNPTAGASVIAGVTGDASTVTAAISQITSGSLEGQVAGLGLVNTLAAAQAADVTYETNNKSALDALATKLGVTVGTDFDVELSAVQSAADAARALAANGGSTATEVLAAQVSADQKALNTAFNALNTAGKSAATAYQNAITANAALKAAAATDVAAVEAGLDAATGTPAALTAAGTAVTQTFTNSTDLYTYYTAATTTAAQRTAIEKAFTDASVSYFSTFKTTASVDVAKKAAVQAEADTKAAVVTADATNGAAYNTASDTLKADNTTYVNAQAADANKAASDALVASNAASEKAVSDATTALSDYNSNHTDSQVVSLTAGAVAANTAKETFYFATTPTGADSTVGTAASHFGAGDAIVLGSGYTFNSGALSTGDNNKLEFFLVNTNTGVQVVVETSKFASASLTADANTGVAASPTDSASVITLTGVTADHLSVANGVISYV